MYKTSLIILHFPEDKQQINKRINNSCLIYFFTFRGSVWYFITQKRDQDSHSREVGSNQRIRNFYRLKIVLYFFPKVWADMNTNFGKRIYFQPTYSSQRVMRLFVTEKHVMLLIVKLLYRVLYGHKKSKRGIKPLR